MILVTGANGFLGSTLCQTLTTWGYEHKQVVRQASHGAICVGNIDDQTVWGDTLSGIDVVVHLAARVHVMRECVSDSLAAFRKVNVLGTERLACAAARAGVRRFIYVSSIKVNGESSDAHGGGFTEENAPNPQDPYAVSKWEAEQALHHISQETGLEVVILRPPLVYGPRVGGNFLRLMQWVHKGMPLPFGAIDNQRSLIYVGNLVSAIHISLDHPAARGELFLVSDGEAVSTPELIRRVAMALGRPSRLVPLPPFFLRLAGRLMRKSVEVDRLRGSLVVDRSKLQRILSWIPPYSFDQGIKETADWYRQTRQSLASS